MTRSSPWRRSQPRAPGVRAHRQGSSLSVLRLPGGAVCVVRASVGSVVAGAADSSASSPSATRVALRRPSSGLGRGWKTWFRVCASSDAEPKETGVCRPPPAPVVTQALRAAASIARAMLRPWRVAELMRRSCDGRWAGFNLRVSRVCPVSRPVDHWPGRIRRRLHRPARPPSRRGRARGSPLRRRNPGFGSTGAWRQAGACGLRQRVVSAAEDRGWPVVFRRRLN